MLKNQKKWYVVYTKPRWEKKVYGSLVQKGFAAYCPLNRIRKRWSDRVKWVEEPLFKSYVFVKVPESDLARVRLVNGVVNFVYWLGKPARVRDSEIETIRKFLDEYEEVVAEPYDLHRNEKITIRRGVFRDKEATVVKVINNKVQVVIESIGYSLVAVIDRSNALAMKKQINKGN
jgi:transcription antitermination factor NusG